MFINILENREIFLFCKKQTKNESIDKLEICMKKFEETGKKVREILQSKQKE